MPCVGLLTHWLTNTARSMDFPKATQQLGLYLGLAMSQGLLRLDVMPQLLVRGVCVGEREMGDGDGGGILGGWP